MKKTVLIYFFLVSMSCFAQFSKTHYIPPIIAQNNLVEDHYIYVSTPSVTPINFKIMEIGGAIITAKVSKNQPYQYFIGTGNNTQLFTSKSTIGIIQNKGYIIEAEALVYANVRVNSVRSTNGNFNHAGGLVSKGNSALGTIFRLGAMLNPSYDTVLLNFACILSTENNTTVTLSNMPIGTKFTDGTVYNGPITVTLKKNESYTLALENIQGNNFPSNSYKMIGALVESNKPVVVNSGSFGGSNSTSLDGRDVGFDQIVSLEKTGKEYIFVKGLGNSEVERVLLITNTPNTIIYINGSATPYATLTQAGDYVTVDGSQFINGNLYVTSSENVFAYQSIGGSASVANQNLFFVPPLNCSTPRTVDNIPQIESIGNTSFSGGLNIVTEKGAVVKINGSTISVSPIDITGKPDFVRFTLDGLSGNIAVKSDKQVYVSYFGTNGAATYGGYYSGFDLKPEIISEIKIGSNNNCIPNLELKISTLSSYDTFEWYKNGVVIPGETSNHFTPLEPGYYKVSGSISACLTNIISDNIAVSNCPTDIDLDKVNDNIDIDNDNDGITNCTESYGNQDINLSNNASGTINVDAYSNSFSGDVTTGGTIIGNTDGSFITEIPAGKDSSFTYKMNFVRPISVGMEYISTANPSDLLNSDAEYIVNSDLDKTITVLNPDNQLLIDTNYDGIYETGITEYSSFEIHFRLNNTIPLAAGTGTFKFLTNLSNSISFTHKNLSETNPNKSTFRFFASCVPKDSDLDGTPDQLDTDSDNDGISDLIEAQINNGVILSNSDTNKNGLDNAFEPGFIPIDTDKDGIPDYLDLDSDNDGISDLEETGNDLDADGIRNFRDLDSDNDLCNDVIEAGFLDQNNDGILGNNTPPTVDTKGFVTSGMGYTTPNSNYKTAAPIVITTQPNVAPTCELQNATISMVDNGGNTYQWQISTDGINWNNLLSNTTYPNVTANSLTIIRITNAMKDYKYRVVLNKIGNSCGLISSETTLNIYTLPVVNEATIIQCDDDLDAISSFNLTVKNDVISTNYANEVFSYYKTLAGANTADASQLITTPLAFENTTPVTMPVWARVVNANGCFSVSKLTLKVSATQIPITFNRKFTACDDFLDINGDNNINNNKRDGISTFNFSSVTNDIKAILPTTGNYTIKYYKNQSDALAELNDITDISNYRNIDYPNAQSIWVRVDSDVDNACYGLGSYVTLTVEKLPYANPVIIPRQCDTDQDGIFTFDTTLLETTLLGTNQSYPVIINYLDANNNPLKDANGVLITSPFPATFATKSQLITAIVTNNTTQKCSEQTSIAFIVDDLPEAFAVPTNLTTSCDDEIDPLEQDGKVAFNTSNFETIILGGQTGMTVNYMDENGNLLPSPLPNPFVTGTQNITATVINPTNTTCNASIILPFIINPLPKINLNAEGNEDELICSNLPTFEVQLQAGIQDGSSTNNYTYIWSKDGTIIPAQTGPTLDVNAEGVYSVEVINNDGCSRTRIIKVTPSDIAHIENVVISDMTDVNTATINVTGAGDYQYSLDEPNGFFQDSNTFTNVPAGIHEIFIKDKNGCGTVSKSIAVVGVPKFFTPNSDGFNDYWNVKGINTTENANSIIYIFDRYGKLLTKISPSALGWDGNYNGYPLPSDDYWYTIKLEDGRESKGHFSLKR